MPSSNLNLIDALAETIKSLYEPASQKNHKLASHQLETFRVEPSAWQTCVQILLRQLTDTHGLSGIPKHKHDDIAEDDFEFFAANTIASLSCKGLQPDPLDSSINDVVTALRQNCSRPHSPVVGQLTLSLGALLVWKCYRTQTNIFESVLALVKLEEELSSLVSVQSTRASPSLIGTESLGPEARHIDQYLITLQVFHNILDVLVCDRKLALSKVKRIESIRHLMVTEGEVDSLFSLIHDANVICDGVSAVQVSCCQTMTAWIKALLWYGDSAQASCPDGDACQKAIMKVASSSVTTLDLREWLLNPVLSKDGVELYSSLCSIASPSNSPILITVLLDTLSHMSGTIQKEMGMLSPTTQSHVIDYLACLEEVSSDLIHHVLYDTSQESMVAKTLLSVALRALHMPDTHIRMGAIKVFHALLLHHLACLKVFEKDDTKISAILHREEILKQFLSPLIDVLFNQVIAFPPVPDYETFDFKTWFEMRDLCANVIADCSVVCQYETILEMAGSELQRWVQFASQDPNAGVLFTRVEACLFSLTTIVSIAPAGKDEYIPLALRLLPQLQYPQDKYEGVLFRAVASRLLLWTAGFIGTHKHHCLCLLPLCVEFLVWICGLKNTTLCESSFGCYVDHAERTTGEAIVAICSASSSFSARLSSPCQEAESKFVTPMSAETETASVLETDELHSLLELLSPLAVMEGAGIETRSAILISIGTLMGMMSAETASTLHSALISSLVERYHTACNSFGRESRKGRESLKLLFVGFECLQLYKDPGLPSINQLGRIEDTNHPLVATLRTHWNIIEESLIGQHTSDTSIESCCHALFNIITECRWYFVGSPMLDKFLKILETSMRRSPNVFHLNAVRGLIRMLGSYVSLTGTGPFLNILDVVTGLTMKELRSEEREAEDLLGMGIDILNVTLKNPLLTHELLNGEILPEIVAQLIRELPECPHPKVRLTAILFFARLIEWLNPSLQEPKWIRVRLAQFPDLMASIISDWENRCELTKKRIQSILLGLLPSILESFHVLLLSCFEDNSCWIRLIGEILMIIRQDESANTILADYYQKLFDHTGKGDESDKRVPALRDLFPLDDLPNLKSRLCSGSLNEVQEAIWLLATEAEAWQLAHSP